MDHHYGAHWHPCLLHPPSLSLSRDRSLLHRHVSNLFCCPDQQLSSSNIPSPSVTHSIAYAFHAQLASSVTLDTLRLLQRLGMQFIHHFFVSAFMVASKVICDDTVSSSYPAHHTLPTPPGHFAHPKPSTNNIPTAIPSIGPGAPPSPPSTISSVPTDRSSRRSSADAYPVPPESQLPTPPASHSNVPPPVDSMSPATPPNYEGDTAKIVSSTGSNQMQISGGNTSPFIPAPRSHVQVSFASTNPPRGQEDVERASNTTAKQAHWSTDIPFAVRSPYPDFLFMHR